MSIEDLIYGVPIAIFGVSIIAICIIFIVLVILAIKHILSEHVGIARTKETDNYNELKGYPNSAVMDEEDE